MSYVSTAAASATAATTNNSSNSSSFTNQQQQQQQQQFACLYTKRKTQRQKKWNDGRLVLADHRAVLHDANPPPGSGDPPLDGCDLSATEWRGLLGSEAAAALSGQTLETEKFLIEVGGAWEPWCPAGTLPPPVPPPSSSSSSMKKLLTSKFQRPGAFVPPPPHARPDRLQAVLGKRRRPLQPGELVAAHYGDGGPAAIHPHGGQHQQQQQHQNQHQQQQHQQHQQQQHQQQHQQHQHHQPPLLYPHGHREPQREQPGSRSGIPQYPDRDTHPQYSTGQRGSVGEVPNKGFHPAAARSISHHDEEEVGGHGCLSRDDGTIPATARSLSPPLAGGATGVYYGRTPTPDVTTRQSDGPHLGHASTNHARPDPPHRSVSRGNGTGGNGNGLFAQNEFNASSFYGIDDGDGEGGEDGEDDESVGFSNSWPTNPPAPLVHPAKVQSESSERVPPTHLPHPLDQEASNADVLRSPHRREIGNDGPQERHHREQTVGHQPEQQLPPSGEVGHDGHGHDGPDAFRLAHHPSSPARRGATNKLPVSMSVSGNQLLALFGAAAPASPPTTTGPGSDMPACAIEPASTLPPAFPEANLPRPDSSSVGAHQEEDDARQPPRLASTRREETVFGTALTGNAAASENDPNDSESASAYAETSKFRSGPDLGTGGFYLAPADTSSEDEDESSDEEKTA